MLKSKIFSTGIILLLTITMTTAAQIEGLWQVNRSNDLVEIRSTNYGIKAKFVDSQDWDHYDLQRKNIYEDRKGNRYYLKSRDRLSWESRDGRRVINLEKARDDYGRRGRSDSYDYSRNDRNRRSYDDRYENHQSCTSSCGSSCTFVSRNARNYDDGLSGTWTNRWRNTIAYVEYDGYNIRMKTNKGRKWITYRRTGKKKPTFKDKWGNRLRLRNNGKLEWKRADGRRNMDFVKNY